MSISNYGELKTAVSDWLNRAAPGIDARVPDFIRLAEADIFRFYNARGNEVSSTITQVDGSESDRIAVPADYREMLNFTCDERPVIRTSLTQIQTRQVNPEVGWPREFARELNEFVLWPFPDSGRVYKLNYYAKLAALSSDTDTNAILQAEPGMYLYASLLQAEPFVRSDQRDLIQIWQGYYDRIMAGVDIERAEEDRSGSNVDVQNAFGSPGTGVSRSGWA